MKTLPQSKIYKTYSTSIVQEEEAKQLFQTAKQVIKCNLKGVDIDEARTMILKISSVNPDRSRDTVQPDGCVLDNFKNNPIVAAFHDYDKPAIGRAIEVAIGKDYIASKMEFTPKGMNPEADMLHDLYKNGFMSAASIGFMPLGADGYEQNEHGGYNFKKWELFEYSLVLIPDNPDALTIMRSKGLNPDEILAKQKAIEEKLEKETTPEEKKNTPIDEKKTEEAAKETPKAEEKKEEPKAEVKDEDNPQDPGYADDTKITELTVVQLKNLIDECLDAEEEENEEGEDGTNVKEDGKSANDTVKKDVGEVTSLAYVLSELQWLSYCFEETEVSQPTLDKLNQVIALVLEMIKDQAELGKKSFKLNDKTIKEGRTLSAATRQVMQDCMDHMKQAHDMMDDHMKSADDNEDGKNDDKNKVTEPDNNVVVPPDDEKSASTDLLQKLANSLKTTNQKQDVIIREQKEQSMTLRSVRAKDASKQQPNAPQGRRDRPGACGGSESA